MTEQHPLTDEMCKKISRFGARSYLSMTQFSLDERARMMELDVYYDMRAAADWQLEQCIDWLENKLDCYTYTFDGAAEIDYDNLFKDFKKAMRPQREDN